MNHQTALFITTYTARQQDSKRRTCLCVHIAGKSQKTIKTLTFSIPDHLWSGERHVPVHRPGGHGARAERDHRLHHQEDQQRQDQHQGRPLRLPTPEHWHAYRDFQPLLPCQVPG